MYSMYMYIVSLCMPLYMYYNKHTVSRVFYHCINHNFTGFFEDCIAEEQFEAQKLDIMRDAVRAKATYNITIKHIENAPICESPEPPESPSHNETTHTASVTTNETTGTEVNQRSEVIVHESVVANGSAVESSEVVANGDTVTSCGGSEVTTNGNVEGSKVNGECEEDGISSCQEVTETSSSNGIMTNGVPSTET